MLKNPSLIRHSNEQKLEDLPQVEPTTEDKAPKLSEDGPSGGAEQISEGAVTFISMCSC